MGVVWCVGWFVDALSINGMALFTLFNNLRMRTPFHTSYALYPPPPFSYPARLEPCLSLYAPGTTSPSGCGLRLCGRLRPSC